METFKTRGIILRTTNYGDTSVICSVYTEIFGVQSYIMKGVRKGTKKSAPKVNYYQPASILEMIVYHNPLKQLQFVKDIQWGILYQQVSSNVVRNTVAMYIIELLQHSLKQPEAHPELYYLAEDTLKQLDTGNDTLAANLPLYFMLHLSSELGFRITDNFSSLNTVLDLKEGEYITDVPPHPYYITDQPAQLISDLSRIQFYNDLENFKVNRDLRRQALYALQDYFKLHIADFGDLKSYAILQQILG
ncbi:MAG: recO [Chitinophagaceae bacterium]|nr:recO [Chitinophagaceae bacterium]